MRKKEKKPVSLALGNIIGLLVSNKTHLKQSHVIELYLTHFVVSHLKQRTHEISSIKMNLINPKTKNKTEMKSGKLYNKDGDLEREGERERLTSIFEIFFPELLGNMVQGLGKRGPEAPSSCALS